MRQIVLDTETTGLEVANEHRIVEIGAVEIINRRLTGRHFHQYVNPGREIDPGASGESLESFKSLRGPLFRNPLTGPKLFLVFLTVNQL